ncbi:MAG: rRNA maturation RNase YbeY [Patescibacteria group bacterium]
MFQYILNNKPSFDVDKKIIDDIFKNISNNIPEIQNGTLTIVFLDDHSIQNLNKTYRNIDKTTDVLSFHYYDDFSELTPEEIAGEIILSETKILAQAKEY